MSNGEKAERARRAAFNRKTKLYDRLKVDNAKEINHG